MTPPRSTSTDRVEAYARDVLAGKYVVGKLVRQACERHLRDLKEGPARGLYWDTVAAERAINFFPDVLRLSSSQWSGQRFTLQPWQEFVVGCVFGWKRSGGLRRFTKALIFTARKQGKSETAAGIALYCLLADKEPAAQVYSAATTRDQAKMIFGAAERMVRLSPPLRGRVSSIRNSISVAKTFSTFKPLAAEAKTLDGLNVHCAVIDEIHEHPNGELIAKLETATGARRQPLIVETTTAGSKRESVCYEHWTFAARVLNRLVPEEAGDNWFAFIATLDEDDDWRDEAVWPKANPSLDVIVPREYLRGKVAIAKADPSEQNNFIRYYMNGWTNARTRAIPTELWERGSAPFDARALRGRMCFGGLDLAAVRDLSSLCLVFPPIHPDERWKALWWQWVPEEDIQERARRDNVPYDVWHKQGLLSATPGNTTDFDYVLRDLIEISEQYKIHAIGVDRMFAQGNGSFINKALDEGLNLVEFGQGYLSMAPAVNEFMRLLLAEDFQHGGTNGLVNWCADNLEYEIDAAGNRKPSKAKSGEKMRIDPMVAAIMAVGMAIRTPEVKPVVSVYATRGLATLDVTPTTSEVRTPWQNW